MIFTRKGNFIRETVNWEKPSEIKKLSNNILECVVYGIKIKGRKDKQNKKKRTKKAIKKNITKD